MAWITSWRVLATLPDLARPARRVADAMTAAPRLAFNAVRHGLLPTPASAALVVLREGPSQLAWKAIGDALARYAATGIDEIALMMLNMPEQQPELINLLAEARPREEATR